MRSAPLLRSFLRVKPEQPGAHYSLGNALGRLRRNAEAMQQYRLAVEQKPDLVRPAMSSGSPSPGKATRRGARATARGGPG